MLTGLAALFLIGCSDPPTDLAVGFTSEAFAKVIPEMRSDEVLELLGEPISRNFKLYRREDGVLDYRDDWNEGTDHLQPQVWRYSKPPEAGKRFRIYQVVIDPQRGRVMTSDSYLSPATEG